MKVGTPFQSPSWRFKASENPDKFGFRSLCSRPRSSAGHLKRFIPKGLEAHGVYEWPQFFENMSSGLEPKLQDCLKKIWNKNFKETIGGRVQYEVDYADEENQIISWHAGKIEEINDEWFKKLLRHRFGTKGDMAISNAIELMLKRDQQHISQCIGYYFFAGLTEAEIAKKFDLKLSVVRALKYIFFDFSALPKDSVAKWLVIRQLAENGDIPEEQMPTYKLIFDMKGELGIKARFTQHHMDSVEAGKAKDYLSNSGWTNMLNINYYIRSKRDLLDYNRNITELGKLSLQKQEIKLREQEARLMELNVLRQQKEMNIGKEEIQEEDLKLLQASNYQASKIDADPRFRQFSDLIVLPK